MPDDSVEIRIDNHEVTAKLLELARRGENLRPLMKNIAGIFASSTEDNFKEEGRPDKWTDLAEITKSNVPKNTNGPCKFCKLKANSQILLALNMTMNLPSSVQIYPTQEYINSEEWQGKTKRFKYLQDRFYC